MKRKICTILILVMFVVSAFGVFAEGYENEIWKNASDWAFTELNDANDKGLIPQIIKGKDFTEKITRLEFAALSVKTYEVLCGNTLPEAQENPFTDTDDADVKKAYSAGFTTGVSATEFGAESELTREQSATMLCRVYKKYKNSDWSIKNDAELETNAQAFSDDAEISQWAKNSVYFMSENGIVNGVGNNVFAPMLTISREEAILISNRIVNVYKAGSEKTEEKEEVTEEVDDREIYRVVFIGGSLTEGGSTWIYRVKNYLQEKMPDKKVETVNVGIGGTTSDYGAIRFSSHVLSKEPDLVFIEFSVNDRTQNEKFNKTYMESMLRQATKNKKVPNVIVLHAPLPVDTDSSLYDSYEKGIKAKDYIANSYKISTVNVYEYLRTLYTTAKNENSALTFKEFLENYYNKSGSGYDVHPRTEGYKLYSDAIIKAFDENYEAMMSAPKKRTVVTTENSGEVDANYTAIPVTSLRMHYTQGEWNVYSSKNTFKTNDNKASIQSNRYWIFPEGIRMLYKTTTESFGLYSKAKAVCLSIFSATAGLKADVYIDEVKVDSVTTASPYHGQNYITKWISLPNDGQEHKVIFTVEGSSNDNYAFAFGCVYEKK